MSPATVPPAHLPVHKTRSMTKRDPAFDAERMRRMINDDTFLSFVFSRQRSASRNLSDDQILKIMFKTYVLEDSVGAHHYNNQDPD
jgi:hypothetical protein